MGLRCFLVILSCLLVNKIILGQDDGRRVVYESSIKKHNYYVDKLQFSALLYEVVRRSNPKAGTSYSLERTDTLLLQTDGSYLNGDTRFSYEGSHYVLTIENSKYMKIILETAKSVQMMNARLNNAYFIDQYLKMISELNRQYPLSYIFWVEPYHIWEVVKNKEIDPAQFKIYTDDLIRETRDSYILIQDRNTSVMNYLVQNILTLEYDILRDSLFLLPVKDRNSFKYFRAVINIVAQQKPEYFFLLAEQYPLHRDFIFNAVEENDKAINRLKKVEGYENAKRAFFKERRSNKIQIFKIVGAYALAGGILAWLISQ